MTYTRRARFLDWLLTLPAEPWCRFEAAAHNTVARVRRRMQPTVKDRS